MDVGPDEVIISLGGRFRLLFDGPFMWNSPELEFSRQPRRINSYVGLRRRGQDEWTWFQTLSVNEICAGLASVGATEIAAPSLRTKDILPVTLLGSALLVGVGLVLLAVVPLLNTRDVPGIQTVAAVSEIAGVIALLVGAACGIIHLWGRPRRRQSRS